jgi:2,3,4,5-tetrahydropyridine-2-carboxylate N-succinyltransferase
MTVETIKTSIEKLYQDNPAEYTDEHKSVFAEFKTLLNTGKVRSAEPDGDGWRAVNWVKEGILVGFRMGQLVDYSIDDNFRYFDKDTYPTRSITKADGVRQVPGGSSVRDGVYLGKGVVIMPPAYINVGAYVDEGSMVDSHALVGSCGQIGKNVHLSAAAQIGGVLEPVGAVPVIIEDNVLVGGNTGIYEGTIVKNGAVIGAGVVLTSGTPVYDLVNENILKAAKGQPLTIPENAVVVPGSRPVKSEFAREHNLSIYSPLIVKYRDEKTDSSTALEDALR